MIYTIIKNNNVLFSGIFEPNLMNYKNLGAILIVTDSDGNVLHNREI